MVKLSKADKDRYCAECFGPVSFVIACDDADDCINTARDTAIAHGAITAGLYSTSDDVRDKMVEACLDAHVALSVNLTGGVFVNQTAAFSDFHATGGNPAANASLVDLAFVSSRFTFVGVRW